MIDELDTLLENASEMLGKLYGIPGGVLVLLTCIVFGYVLKMIKRFPNDGIPVAVILWGVVFNMLIADPLADRLSIRIWLVKNALVGVLVGGIAWLVHNKGLSLIEGKIPILKNLISRADNTTPTP